MLQEIVTPNNFSFKFLGPSLDKGALPALFYFSLTAEESLLTDPYNQCLTPLLSSSIRLFSITLPYHGEKGGELLAMQKWAEGVAAEERTVQTFIEKTAEDIRWLLENGVIEEEKLFFAGLSRGAFFATHLAARLPATLLLCFAPLTYLNHLEEFKKINTSDKIENQLKGLNLISLIEDLTHLRYIRCYIGNRDQRVGTDPCYHFIRSLVEVAYEKKVRTMQIEMNITQSIGNKGHGTSPAAFTEGGNWVKTLI